ALGLEFSPALVQGEPRAVKIGFEYVFSVDDVETTDESLGPEKPKKEAPRVGEIGGVLLLASTETPLPGIVVTVVDGLGMEYEAVTDAEGKWRIENMAPGTYDLEI